MPNQPIRPFLAGLVLLCAAGCATTQKPVLYPNAHLKNVGDATAQRDIGECMQLVENSGVAKSGNQVVKRGAEGAAVGGTAGAVHGAFRNDTSPTYRNFVQRCLRERGYDVIGWQ